MPDVTPYAAKFVVGQVIRRIAVKTRLFFVRRPLRLFWRFNLKNSNAIRLVCGVQEAPPGRLGYHHLTTLAIRDCQASIYLTTSLVLAYKDRFRLHVCPSTDFNEDFWSDSLVFVGGKVRNGLTERILDKLDTIWVLPFTIHDTDPDQAVVRYIYDGIHRERYESTVKDGKLLTDYGVLTRAPNPFNQGSPIFVFYGLHALGTVGLTKLVTPKFIRELIRASGEISRPWFQTLVEVDVNGEEVFPRIIAIHELQARSRGRLLAKPQ